LMNAADDLPRRRDDEGDFHNMVAGTCIDCGCTLFSAQDDPSVIWEPGASWDETCRDRSCHCHTEPVIGARRE
jgi:hypothetical protein